MTMHVGPFGPERVPKRSVEDIHPEAAAVVADVVALTRCPDCPGTAAGLDYEAGANVIRVRHAPGCPWLERASVGAGVVVVVHVVEQPA